MGVEKYGECDGMHFKPFCDMFASLTFLFSASPIFSALRGVGGRLRRAVRGRAGGWRVVPRSRGVMH